MATFAGPPAASIGAMGASGRMVNEGSWAGDWSVPCTSTLKSVVSYDPRYPAGRDRKIAPSEVANSSAAVVAGAKYRKTGAMVTLSSSFPVHVSVTGPAYSAPGVVAFGWAGPPADCLVPVFSAGDGSLPKVPGAVLRS